MKPRDIQRSVRAQRVDRAAGDAPNIGRVGRVPGTRFSKGTRHRRRRGGRGTEAIEKSNRRLFAIVWSVVFMFIALATVIVCVVLWVRPNSGDSNTFADSHAMPVEVKKRVQSEFASPSEDEALEFVKQALGVRDKAQVAEYFRLGQNAPAAVLDLLTELDGPDNEVKGFEWLSSMDSNGLLLEGVLVRTHEHGREGNRLAFLTPDEKGVWRVDFGAFGRVVEPSWEDVMKLETPRAMVRVIVGKDTYFNGVFGNDLDWDCYGMASPDHEKILIGYCRKDSPQARAMERIMEDGEERGGSAKLHRAVLELSRVGGASVRQFEISKVLAQDWVVGDLAFDEGFK